MSGANGTGGQEPYAKIPKRLLRDATVQAMSKLVYAGLDSRADKDGVCWPCYDTLVAGKNSHIGKGTVCMRR